jgi:hypothetical protein
LFQREKNFKNPHLRQQKQCEQTASMAELKTVTLAATIINSLFAI